VPVEVQDLETEIDVLPSTGPATTTGGLHGGALLPHTEEQLEALLRPLVRRILEEELDRHLRTRG
jgi:hypothetical protein